MSEKIMNDDARQQLGAIVRQLHDALQALGYDTVLQEVAQEIPDARERLTYVGQMTERAAHKVLTLVDQAKPDCVALAHEGEELLSLNPAAPEQLKAFAQKSVGYAQTQQSTLNDIMMAQDFQDLSGQVIQKVIGIISRTEQQLLDLLVHGTPAVVMPRASAMLAGPQVPDKAMDQENVDDLLESLGF
ncbi:MAG: protein phosphatase CheZ [Leptothrix sp. (in: b-proteobacteria)]